MAEIKDLNESWSNDHDGDEVEAFIKRMIREVMAGMNGKYGGTSFEGGVLRFYDEDGGKQLGAVTITGTSYSVKVDTNIQSSNFTVLTSDESYPIVLTPTTTSMEFGSTEKNDYPEDYTFSLEVDNGMGYVDKTPENNSIKQGGSATIDVRNFLKIGTNRIRIVVTGASSGQPKTLGYTATLTSLSLSCSHPWHQVWIQGDNFAITNIFFAGNIAKTLHVKVGDAEYTKGYTASTSYDKQPATFDLTNNTPSASGIVPVELWVTGDGVETKHIHYNIMYVSSEDVGKISLICTNKVKDNVYNFTEETLLEYAVYGISSLTTKVVASFKDNDITLLDSTGDVVPQTVYQLKMSLQIDTTESQGISLSVQLSSDNASVEEVMNVDNSNAYLATEGYKFYLNASLGNNDSADREYIQNSAILQDSNYKAVYHAEGNNMTYADDMWHRDTDGNRALVVKAGADLTVTDLKPLQYSNTKSATFELMYRASNIADYDTPILTVMDTEEYTPQSVGFIVFPTRIVLLGTVVRQELFQQLPLSEDRIHHIGVVIQRGYAASSLNLARIYINGCENVTFQFSGGNMFYNSTGNNQLRIGQGSTDTYLYMMRIYDFALEANQMFANYLNALIETAESSRNGLREDNNITDGTSISYDLCKKAGFNCFVMETPNDQPIPSLANPVEYSSGCNYHFEYNDHPEWDVSIYDAPGDRQGTTSNLYAWSNLRMKNKKAIRWVYHNLKDAQGNVLEEISKDGYIAGFGLNPRVSIFTMKKNIASQPGGHKMAGTAMYNNGYKRIMGGADKLVSDKILPTKDARVAVLQYPFMGFQKFSDGTYKFIGLYSGGADKKDKKTFGYNETEAFPSLMMIEGPNHDPYLTRFLIPWTSDVFYDSSAETLSVGAKSASDGAKQEGWDADIVADYSADDSADEAAIQTLYESEFKPAYDAIYYNSPYIASLAESGYTLDEINANVSAFQKEKTRGYSNILLTFYDDNYNLVYYRVKTGKYEVLDKSVHDMLAYLGLSGTPTTDEIFAARKANWLPAVSQVVNMREAYYSQVFKEFYGVSDNDAKNTYWRKFLALVLGGKWGFNEDDVDTLFQDDNNGQDTKSYFVEPDDTSALGADIFQGRTSAFWYALRQNCKDQLKGMFHEYVDAMYAEAEELGLLAPTVHQTIFNLIDHYFWRQSSKYYPATAYNQDTQLAYIDVWYSDPDRVYNNVPPLTQIHGDHYETEREWVAKRIAYMFSKYQIGAFEAGQADGMNSLEFTPAEAFTMEVTPAIDLYPRVSYGGSQTENSQRTKAGDTCPLVLSASGTTGNYIKGMDWLSDLGDLSDLKLSPRSAADAAISFSVKGKRLRRLKVGDENKTAEEIKFNAATLGVESEALELLDARNASTIEGSVSLAKCPRISEAYLRGTNLKSVIPPTGGRLTTLQMPESLQDLILHSLNLLEIEGLELPESALANIRNLYINSCKHINPVDLLKRIYDTPDNKLTAIGLIWKGTLVDEDGSFMRMFGKIAEKAGQDGGYSGVDFTNDITPMTMPNVSGALDATGLKGVYQEDIDNILAKLPNLLLSYNADNLYISFANEEVLSVLLDNGVGDGVGITKEAAEKVTSIGTWFKGNTLIQSFDEFAKFTGIKSLNNNSGQGGEFQNCTNLKSLVLPQTITSLNFATFNNTPNLTNLVLSKAITTIGSRIFNGCGIETDIDLPNLIQVSSSGEPNSFSNSGIRKIVNLGKITTIPNGSTGTGNGVFKGCTKLESVILPDTLLTIGSLAFQGCTSLSEINIHNSVTTIGQNAFYGCTSLEIEDLNLPNLETLGQNAFYGVKIKKMVLGKLTALPAATTATQNFGDKSVLEEVVLPETLTSIPNGSFYQYTNCVIEDLNLPNLTTLGGGAFNGTKLRKITSLGSVSEFPAESANTSNVFRNCKELVYVDQIVFDNIIKIAGNPFNGCENLYIEELKFPKLEDIGVLGAGIHVKVVKDLGAIKELFGSVELTTNSHPFGEPTYIEAYHIPSSVTSIGRYAFRLMSNLKYIICNPATPPSLSSDSNIAHSSCPIYVPDSSVTAYREASVWSAYASRIYPMSIYDEGGLAGQIIFEDPAVEAICLANFDYNNNGYISKAEAASVTNIGKTFANTSIVSFNELRYFGITALYDTAMENCGKLESVTLPESLTYMGWGALQKCPALERVIILNSESVVKITSSTFSSTPILDGVYVPDNLVEEYKITNNWVNIADRIKPLSEYAE